MCTLIIAKNVYENFPIVVAANRDELLDRPSEGPQIWDSGTIFAPKDLQRGGTWIGVNAFGVFAGLTNRIDVESVPSRQSRGGIVLQALRQKTAEGARKAIAELDGKLFNGFYLAIADAGELFLFKGNCEKITWTKEPDGLCIATNRGVGRGGSPEGSKRIANTLRVWEKNKLAEKKPTPGFLEKLLAVHDGPHGTCINTPEDNYGSLSSSIVRLRAHGKNSEWQYWHRDRKSLKSHVCAENFLPQPSLAIEAPADH